MRTRGSFGKVKGALKGMVLPMLGPAIRFFFVEIHGKIMHMIHLRLLCPTGPSILEALSLTYPSNAKGLPWCVSLFPIFPNHFPKPFPPAEWDSLSSRYFLISPWAPAVFGQCVFLFFPCRSGDVPCATRRHKLQRSHQRL